jgi:restriction system protein
MPCAPPLDQRHPAIYARRSRLPRHDGGGGQVANNKTKGPVFLKYVKPVVESLQVMGNSGTAAEVVDSVIERLKISEAEQQETTSNGQSRVRNQIAWARFYLTKAGILDASQRGVWSLTDQGGKTKLDPESIHALFKKVHSGFKSGPEEVGKEPDDGDGEDLVVGQNYRVELLKILRGLPPPGFERVCQRLLRESGFQNVEVTGRSGDGGIDGHGILEVNPLVTFKVLFQCKRYKSGGQVTSSQVRDFRGALDGRADKGIIITTATFTPDAKKEASRDGVKPIELVDQDKLVTIFERAGLGLRAVQTFEIDHSFFEEFGK